MSKFNLSAFGADLSRGDLVIMARVAETAERYEDMCAIIKSLITLDASLSVEERNLLSVAYKNVVGTRRSSWRTINSEAHPDAEEKALIEVYRTEIEKELNTICLEVIGLLTDHLIPKVTGKKDESEVFFLKMAGDYYRYLAEFQTENGKNAAKFYEQALVVAKENLHETHPTRLGLSLNYSVCHYEILKDPNKACQLAKEAFDDAIQKLDSLDDASYKDSTLIMQLLRDNLTLWTSENTEEANAEDAPDGDAAETADAQNDDEAEAETTET
jgi:hypothetical protein